MPICSQAVDDPVLVVNTEVVTGASIQRLLSHHRRSGEAATLLATPHDAPEDFDVSEVGRSGVSATHLVEKPRDRVRGSLVNAGIYVLAATHVPAGVAAARTIVGVVPRTETGLRVVDNVIGGGTDPVLT